MKKAVAVLLMFLLLALPTSAASAPDVDFSVTDVSGKVGETVSVTVNMTKNPGIWSARLTVRFDPDALKLIDVYNGEVFTNGEFSKSLLTNRGYYLFYAQRDLLSDTVKTGKLMTLEFEVLPGAGKGTEVFLEFPDGGMGWFFSSACPTEDYTVPENGRVRGTVTVKPATGDVNFDGKVNAADAIVLKRAVVGKETGVNVRTACDINGDGKVNAGDAVLLKRIIVGKAGR